jgi:spore germination protein GerM
MLLKGPKDSKLKSIIPEGTQVLGTKLNKNCVTINLSKEFIENAPEDVNEKSNMIYMIINTLTELKEVESIRFLIEGEEVEGFKEEAVKLNNEFVRKKIN